MKKNQIILTMLVCLLYCVSEGQAKITLPPLFSDGMVLQQQSSVVIWGSTDRAGTSVSIKTSWNGKSYKGTADDTGRWRLKIETPESGGPYKLEISDGEKVYIDNVLIGEVWLCSGQSNMDMRVSGRYGDPVIGSLDAIVTSENPEIRMFTVERKMESKPLRNCKGEWQQASPETVPEFSAIGYFFARKLYEVLKVPVGIIHASYGGSRVEAWMSKEGAKPYKELPEVRNSSILYNGMLNPIVGYGIRGCLWYQGEANVDAPDLYMQLFPSLVADWREKWGIGEFPFYYAQIAPFKYHYKGDEQKNNSAYLREAQMKCLKLIPSSGMVVLMDVGDSLTIHPMQKEAVGNRFAYLALGKIYGKCGFPTTGPLYKKIRIEGNTAILFFDEIWKGLTSFRKPLTGFEIAGSDRKFYPAQVQWGKDMQTLVVYSSQVASPVAVRYAFCDYMKGCLYNTAGLPASSFRTDEW